jgi:hypothetical protein
MPQELQVSGPSFSSLWAMGRQVEYPTYIIRQVVGRQGPPHFAQSEDSTDEFSDNEVGVVCEARAVRFHHPLSAPTIVGSPRIS